MNKRKKERMNFVHLCQAFVEAIFTMAKKKDDSLGLLEGLNEFLDYCEKHLGGRRDQGMNE
jgi:hypothetical protein